MAFTKFMASTNGRILRIVAGIILIALGLVVVGDTGGIVLAVVGVLPLAAGVFDFCVFAPLLGQPFTGRDIRAQ